MTHFLLCLLVSNRKVVISGEVLTQYLETIMIFCFPLYFLDERKVFQCMEREVGGRSKGRGYIYPYGQFMLVHDRNHYNIVS